MLFSRSDHAEAATLLVEDCADNLPLWPEGTPDGLERIRFAVLKLSEGNLEELLEAICLAQVDWRDALISAGFGDDTRAHETWWPDANVR